MYEIKRGTKYKHYKGKVYTAIYLSTHTETMECLITYRDENECIWSRPAEMFFGYLEDGTKRFVEMEDDDSE